MKKSQYTVSMIVSILKKHENGVSAIEICREYGIGPDTFNHWKAKYSGMGTNVVNRLKELEAENARLKKMYAKISMENYALRDMIEIKL